MRAKSPVLQTPANAAKTTSLHREKRAAQLTLERDVLRAADIGEGAQQAGANMSPRRADPKQAAQRAERDRILHAADPCANDERIARRDGK